MELIKAQEGITCVCFMGGDNDIPSLGTLAQYVRNRFQLHTAWYTGLQFRPKDIERPITLVFDYIKTGPYIEEMGPITSKKTNQRMYAKGRVLHKMDVSNEKFYDITGKFWKDES